MFVFFGLLVCGPPAATVMRLIAVGSGMKISTLRKICPVGVESVHMLSVNDVVFICQFKTWYKHDNCLMADVLIL